VQKRRVLCEIGTKYVYDLKYINVSLCWFKRLIVGFSTREHWLDPEPDYVKFVVDTGALQQGFLRVAQFSSVNIIPLLLHIQLPFRIMSKKQIWQISDIVMLFWIWGSNGNRSTFTLFGLTTFNKQTKEWSKRGYRFLPRLPNFKHSISIRSVKDLSHLLFPSLKFVTILTNFLRNRHSSFPMSNQQSLEPNSVALNVDTCPSEKS